MYSSTQCTTVNGHVRHYCNLEILIVSVFLISNHVLWMEKTKAVSSVLLQIRYDTHPVNYCPLKRTLVVSSFMCEYRYRYRCLTSLYITQMISDNHM